MSIRIDNVRVKNFRALRSVSTNMMPLTLLVGMNNAGKTTLLRALNCVLGASRPQLNRDDLFIDQNGRQPSQEISIDLRIIPVDEQNKRQNAFKDEWRAIFNSEDLSIDHGEQESLAFRTSYTFKTEDAPSLINYKTITDWDSEAIGDDFGGISQLRKSIKMYFIDAQRDLEQHLRLRTSFFGRLASQLEHDYEQSDIEELGQLIEKLNTEAVEKSDTLRRISTHLEKLNQTAGGAVSIHPFPKKIRDLHKGMKVNFQDGNSDSFGMEYHGMGTRSWASMLTVGAYVDWEVKNARQKIKEGEDRDVLPFFPIVALEEPEAHLHPNAQRSLYNQLKAFGGQKIISTHSPYIAGQADLKELRHFSKPSDCVEINRLDFRLREDEEIKALRREMKESNNDKKVCRRNNPRIEEIKEKAEGKLDKEAVRKIRKEIMHTRGELLFSKVLMLFEGETEEAALPIFAKDHFDGKYPFELGVTLVGVGGKKNYTPFLRIAKFLKIPCIILSDGDGDTEREVKKQIENVFEGDSQKVKLFVLEGGCDFEAYLLKHGFEESILIAIDEAEGKADYINLYIERSNGKSKKKKKEGKRDYFSEGGRERAILDCMYENKTKYAEQIAHQIALKIGESDSISLPPKIAEALEAVKEMLSPKEKQKET